jgi:SEC-C motif-containing protein
MTISDHCPCGSTLLLTACCQPFIEGSAWPPSAEALMRSRYTAYTLANIPYIKRTLAPESQGEFDAAGTRQWAEQSFWKGLEIISTHEGTPSDNRGVVEFVAHYEHSGQSFAHRETSRFRKDGAGHWLFVDGEVATPEAATRVTHVRSAPKIGRNDVCPCGSGKKFKKCCEDSAAP